MPPQQEAVTPAAGTPGAVVAESLGDVPAPLPESPPCHQHEHAQQLQEGEGRSGVELQALHGETPYLGVQCRPARPPEDEDHPEGGEVEEEHDGAHRDDGRCQAWQRDGAEHPQPVGPQHRRSLLGRRIQLRPEGPHRAGDHRVVEEHVGRQDCPHGVMESIGQSEAVHERQEGGGHHQRGQDERHHQQGVHEAPAPEAQACQHRGGGQGGGQAEPRGGQRLPGGEPQHVGRYRVAPHLQGGAGVEGAGEYPGQRVQEEHPDEGRRYRRQGHGYTPAVAERHGPGVSLLSGALAAAPVGATTIRLRSARAASERSTSRPPCH